MKKLMTLLLVLLLAVSAAACSKEETQTPPEPQTQQGGEVQPEPQPEPEPEPQPESKPTYAPEEYDFGETVTVDMDGDGAEEEVTAYADGEGYVLRIGDKEIRKEYSEALIPRFALADIDMSDSYKEIIISEEGPSNDPTSDFYAYADGEIIYMNEGANMTKPLPHPLEEWERDTIESTYADIKIYGNGLIECTTRADLLQTWFFSAQYVRLTNHRLLFAPQIFETEHRVELKRELLAYADVSAESEEVRLPAGGAVLTATDNISWVEVTADSGERGWLLIESYNNIISGTEVLSAPDVMDGLSYAD